MLPGLFAVADDVDAGVLLLAAMVVMAAAFSLRPTRRGGSTGMLPASRSAVI